MTSCNNKSKTQCVKTSRCEWENQRCKSLKRVHIETLTPRPQNIRSRSLPRHERPEMVNKCKLIKFQPVQLHRDYEITKAIESTSASATDTFIVQHKQTGMNYFVKLFIKKTDNARKPVPKSYFYLKNEIRICRYLKCALVDKYNVRNILLPVSEGKLTYEDLFNLVKESRTNTLTDTQIRRNIIVNTEYMMNQRKTIKERKPIDAVRTVRTKGIVKNIDKFTYKFMLSPLVQGLYENFSEFLSKPKPGWKWTVQNISRYFAIVCYTLLQMAEVGVNQNDLHFGNILVNRKMFGPTPYHMRIHLIVTPTDTYIIDNEFTVFIFDYDRSVLKGEYNESFKCFEYAGNCPHFHLKRDLLKALCGFYKHMSKYRYLQSFREDMIKTLVTHDYVYSKIVHSHKYCWLSVDSERPAVGCRNEYLNEGLVDSQEIVSFFFEQAKFKSIPTKQLVDNHATSVQTAICAISKQFPRTTDGELKKYVKANVQFSQGVRNRDRILSNLYQALI